MKYLVTVLMLAFSSTSALASETSCNFIGPRIISIPCADNVTVCAQTRILQISPTFLEKLIGYRLTDRTTPVRGFTKQHPLVGTTLELPDLGTFFVESVNVFEGQILTLSAERTKIIMMEQELLQP